MGQGQNTWWKKYPVVLITSRGERVKSISSNKNHSLGHKGTRKGDIGETDSTYIKENKQCSDRVSDETQWHTINDKIGASRRVILEQ